MKIILKFVGWFLVLYSILIAFVLEHNGYKIVGLQLFMLFFQFLIGIFFLIKTKDEFH